MKYEISKKKRILAVFIVVVLVLCFGLFMKNKTNTLNNSSINKESVTKELNNNLIGAYIQEGEEYIQTDNIPSSGYEFNEEKSYCKIGDIVQEDTTLSYDMNTQTITVSPITKEGLKCYLYFDEKASGSEYILAQEGGIDVIKSKGTPNFSESATADEGMYAAEDDYGTSYYYRGAVNDNWIKFGVDSNNNPIYWRIIRINGNGTIRLIYNGISTSSTGENTQIGAYAFNNSNNNNAYVGYMYQIGQVHGLSIDSNAKVQLDNWYARNLEDEAKYLDGSTGFCGDREPSTNVHISNGLGGTGTTQTFYGSFIRVNINKTPSLKCLNSSDLYTTAIDNETYPNPKENGNQTLIYPIGLITADEVAVAGWVNNSSNSRHYLYTGQAYWTMSPVWYDFGGSGNFQVNGENYNDYWFVTDTFGLRPVINLKADVQITGSGTVSDPFKVVGAS